MSSSPKSTCLGGGCRGQKALLRPEGAELRGLTALVGRIFHVPVAYAALLGKPNQVMSRVGTGLEFSKYVKTLPLDRGLASPWVVRDAPQGLPPGADLGDLHFMASAPVLTLCERHIGVLVIADLASRPGFSTQDVESLVQLAGAISNSFELRMLATESLESRLRLGEAEERFREVANRAPELIACVAADGGCEFVNDTWLSFTGRRLRDERGDGWSEALHSEHRDRILNLHARATQAIRPFSIEAPLRHHGGVFRWVRGGGTPRILKNGEFAGFIFALTVFADYDETPAEQISTGSPLLV
jgi:PAS domain S-box-containing protein